MVTASYGHYGQRADRIRPDRICRIRLPASVSAPFFQRRPGPYCENRPGSDLDGLVRVWPHTSGLEASYCVGIIRPGFWHDASGPLPISHFLNRFHSPTDDPDNTVQNQPGSSLVLADCVRFWPNGSGPEASRCARIIRPDSGQCFPPDPDRMGMGSGMFTGKLICKAVVCLEVVFAKLGQAHYKKKIKLL